MRASAILLLYCALAFTAGRPGTPVFPPSFAPPSNSASAATAQLPTYDLTDAELDACTPLSGPHFQPSNAVERAEAFGGRASVALRGALGAAQLEAPTVGDLPVRGVKPVAVAHVRINEPGRRIHSCNTRISSVNRRWLTYGSSLALRRAGLLSARSTSPAPPLPPRV